MKAPQWKQQVLFVTGDPEVKLRGLSAFGAESNCVVVPDAAAATLRLEHGSFDVFIIDGKALNDGEGKESVSFLELTQYANQLSPGITIVVLVNKLRSLAGDFARKSGASLIMDRKDFSIDRMIFVIRVLRRRTFRTILLDDLIRLQSNEIGFDIYYYLPLSNRYAITFPKNEPFSDKRLEQLKAARISHLFVREADFHKVIQVLQDDANSVGDHQPIVSRDLSLVREHFKKTLNQLFDISTDGNVHAGILLFDRMMELANELEALVLSYPDFYRCLERLPYPRWSSIAHGINSAIYTQIFAKICKFEDIPHITVAALYHNIGLSEVNQSLLSKSENEMSAEEKNAYSLHVAASLEIFKRKRVVLPKATELAISQHHENYYGTGYPEKLVADEISVGARLLSIVGSFDYFISVRPSEQMKTPIQAWLEFKKSQEPAGFLNHKFDPNLIAKLDEFFLSSKKD